jgi:hypothetical protein
VCHPSNFSRETTPDELEGFLRNVIMTSITKNKTELEYELRSDTFKENFIWELYCTDLFTYEYIRKCLSKRKPFRTYIADMKDNLYSVHFFNLSRFPRLLRRRNVLRTISDFRILISLIMACRIQCYLRKDKWKCLLNSLGCVKTNCRFYTVF